MNRTRLRRPLLDPRARVGRALLTGAMVALGVLGSAPSAAAFGPARTWRAPLPDPLSVLRGFDPPEQRWLAGHRGVDLAAPAGTVVRAAGAGQVTFAGPLAGRGVVVVQHGSLRTTYEPVTAAVVVGEVVVTGQLLGRLQASTAHCGGRSCLHWGLLRGDTYLDPLALLGPPAVRLLPFTATAGSPAAAAQPAAAADGPASVDRGSPAGLQTASVAGLSAAAGAAAGALAWAGARRRRRRPG